MAYLGKTPSQATRARYYYTATGGETSLSGSDDNGNTLVFSDGNYVDVMLNGVTLVAGTDYDTTTANTIGGLTALTASDVVEIVVYDTFSVFGGDVNGDFNVTNGGFTVTNAKMALTSSDPEFFITETDTGVVHSLDANSGVGNFYLHVDKGDTGSAPKFILNVGSNSNVIYAEETETRFYTGGSEAARFNSSGNLVFPNGQGIDFSDSEGSGATSSILDDYEEGTWTPALADANSGGNESSTSAQDAIYTKVGNLVTMSCLFLDIDTTGLTGANRLYLTGFPFESISRGAYAVWAQGIDLSGGVGNPVARINPGYTYTLFDELQSAGNDSAIICSDLTSGTADIIICITYTTNS